MRFLPIFCRESLFAKVLVGELVSPFNFFRPTSAKTALIQRESAAVFVCHPRCAFQVFCRSGTLPAWSMLICRDPAEGGRIQFRRNLPGPRQARGCRARFGELSAGAQAKRPSEPTQAITSSASVPAAKRRPSSHSAPSASGSRSVALEPMPLDPDVQKGTIVLPEKS